MPDWVNAKAAVKITLTEDEGIFTTVQMSNRFSSNVTQNWDRIHGFSDGEYNSGAVRKVPEITFSLTVPANSSSSRFLRAVHVSKKSAIIEVADNLADASGFTIVNEIYYGCRVTSIDTTYEMAEVPRITYAGIALSYSFSDVDSDGNVGDLITYKASEDGDTVEYSKPFGDGLTELNSSIKTDLFDDVW